MKRGSPSGSFGAAPKRRKHESFDAASSAAAIASHHERGTGSNDRFSRGGGGRGVGGSRAHSSSVVLRGRGSGANRGGTYHRGGSSFAESYRSDRSNCPSYRGARGGYHHAHTTSTLDESFRPRVCDVTTKDKLAAAAYNSTTSRVPAAAGQHQRSEQAAAAASPHQRVGGSVKSNKKARDVVVILEKAGLLQGHVSLVDAYERAATTEIANESLRDVRPDIVHQCLLALFDSDLAAERHLRVYINLIARVGKVVEVSPGLRPPRTYARFCGLMSVLLRDGRVCSAEGEVLMRTLPGSLAPVLPHGAEVVGVVNALASPVRTAMQLAQQAQAEPVSDALQGGIKNVSAFYCVSCTDDCDLSGVDYVSRTVCLSPYPLSSHVMCSRLCEAHARVL